MKKHSGKTQLNTVYDQIISILETARHNAYRAVNHAMVQAYWHIGRLIVDAEQKGAQRAGYGEHLINKLAERLTKEYGKGYNETNLKYFRQFYLSFEIGHATRDQFTEKPGKSHALRDRSVAIHPSLTWTHYRLLLKVDDPKARAFYIQECAAGNWSTRQLERQINSFYYERLQASKDKSPVRKEAALTASSLPPAPSDIIKDPYVLEFLGLKENRHYLESELEQAIIGKLQEFLLELGKGFCFVARQQRITADNDHFYIDLVFYNYILKCFLLVDLKTGKLTHQDIGQMDFYVRYYEANVKQPGDNPTIGLILCSEKNETVVKYSVINNSKQLFASKYKLYLPSERTLSNEITRERKQLEGENPRSLKAGS